MHPAKTRRNTAAPDITLGRICGIHIEDRKPRHVRVTVDVGDISLLSFVSSKIPEFQRGDLVGVQVVREGDVATDGWMAASDGVRWRLCSTDEIGISRGSDAVFVVGPGMRLATSVVPEADDQSRRTRYDMLVIPEWAVST